MTAVLVAAVSALGLMVGAMLDVVIVRVPQGRSLLAPGARADVRWPRCGLLAVGCAALFGLTAARFAASWALPAYLVLSAGLLTLSIIDLEHFLLPNRVVYPTGTALLGLLGVATLAAGEWSALLRAVAGGAVAFGVMLVMHLLSPVSLGLGDVRLAFVLGLGLGWLGWGEVALGFFLGFLYGAVIGGVLVLARVRGRKDHVPFGPFLAAGTITAVLWGSAILRWYDGR